MAKLKIEPPIAEMIENIYEIHDEKIKDDYFWLRDKDWPDVKSEEILAYIDQENLYYQQQSSQFEFSHEDLYNEMVGRELLEDQSIPIKKGNFLYYTRIEKGLSYPIYFRKDAQGLEAIIFNPNELAPNHPNFKLGKVEVSENHDQLLYSIDFNGSERFEVFTLNIIDQTMHPEKIENVMGNIVWDLESLGFFYIKVDEYWRSNQVYYHSLGLSQDQDCLIYKEEDPIFYIEIKKSASEKYLIIDSHSLVSSEVWLYDLKSKSIDSKAQLIIPRKENILYTLDHINHEFYVLTNDKDINFRLVRFNETDSYQENLPNFISYSQDVYFTDVFLYDSYFAVEYKAKGLIHLDVFSYDLSFKDTIPFQDPAYDLKVIATPRDAEGMIYEYSSLNTPRITYQYNFSLKEIVTLKTDNIPGYDKAQYESMRLHSKSHDGLYIPISLVYKKSLFKADGSNPLLLYGYGAYGSSIPSKFKSEVISLLDRGFVYAIAHIRGGDDMGYKWYEDGKFLKKKNTFFDFISCAEHLIENKYTSKGNLSIEGRSAGGILVGFCINEKPELFRAAIAGVPFVDVLNTMLDPTLPLTPNEYVEWGNPNDKNYFDYIQSYSPYDNIKRQAYPILLMTAGLNDPRVGYWEAAKFVAKLRQFKTDNNLLLLHTFKESGHFGGGGRYKALKEIAQIYSFLLEAHS